MEDGDTEKYHPSSVIQDFVFSSRKGSCIRCISLQVYNKTGDLGMGSKGQLPLDFLKSVGICDGAPSNVF